MSQHKKHGSLSGVSRTRKFDTWKFRTGQREMAIDLEFDVYINPDLSFRVETKSIPPERYEPVEGKDLSALHAQVQDISRKEFDLRNSLTWSDWLEVQVRNLRDMDMREVVAGSQACVTYRTIPRAETSDGKAYTLNTNNLLVSFPQSISALAPGQGEWGTRGLPRKKDGTSDLVGLLQGHDNRPPYTQFTYLPDTPENRAGLDAIIDAIEQANIKLNDFLSESKIGQTIARARHSTENLLSGPPPSPPRPTRRP